MSHSNVVHHESVLLMKRDKEAGVRSFLDDHWKWHSETPECDRLSIFHRIRPSYVWVEDGEESEVWGVNIRNWVVRHFDFKLIWMINGIGFNNKRLAVVKVGTLCHDLTAEVTLIEMDEDGIWNRVGWDHMNCHTIYGDGVNVRWLHRCHDMVVKFINEGVYDKK